MTEHKKELNETDSLIRCRNHHRLSYSAMVPNWARDQKDQSRLYVGAGDTTRD